MAVKPKGKSKKTVKAKVRKIVKPRKVAAKKAKQRAKPVKKLLAASKRIVKPKAPAKSPERAIPRPAAERPILRTPGRFISRQTPIARQPAAVVKRVVNPLVERRPVISRSPRIHQFAYMKAPGLEHEFEVGDTVEVFCDHEKNRERIRGWVRGIVVQVDNKMVAVQFRSNVFLTDGWMVPDRILWYPVNSVHIRPVPGKKPVKKDFIPDY